MAELKASEQGLKQIKEARNKRGWTVDNPCWLVEASKILDPERDWKAEEGIYANGVSSGTWKAFLFNKSRKKGIRTEVFKAYCQVLDIPWDEVIEQTIDNPRDSIQGNEANQLAARFGKAIRQLGSADDYIRLSSIYELEQIAKDAEEEYYWKVMETLTWYVRKRSPWNKEKEAKAKTEQDIPPLANDIQRVMTVLARRKYTYGHRLEPQRLDLQNVNLQGLKLPAQPQANMRGVDFSGANLVRADLLGANLQEAIFDEANLNNAILDNANLNSAQFHNANLNGAQFREATLQKAIFAEAKLQSACFFGADLQSASFFRAELKAVSFAFAHLQTAQFCEANLYAASFWGANLQDAGFRMSLGGAAIGLTPAMFRGAVKCEYAVFPDNLSERIQSLQEEEAKASSQETQYFQLSKIEVSSTQLEEEQVVNQGSEAKWWQLL